MRRFEGKVALITGAARGIGRGIALCLAEEGASVVLNDLPPRTPLPEQVRVPLADAAATAREVEALGVQALPFYADVSDRSQVEALVAAAVAAFGRLDIVVANAALSLRGPILDAPWEHVLRTIEVVQFGTFHTCQLGAQQMARQGGGGKIVIVSSVLAEIPMAGSAAYNMAKAAISHLGRTLAAELAPQRINVNMLHPGYTDTPGERNFASEQQLQDSGLSIPWGRLGTAREMGRAACFLCSDDADYITGSTLIVDGGYRFGLKLQD